MATSNDNGFTGYRYLVDATGSREYAVKYENGKPSKNIEVFDENGKADFKPGETIYAFDDEIKTGSSAGGLLKVSPVAIQIIVNSEGRPVKLKQVGVDYDMSFDTTPGAPPVASYTMTAASRTLLQENGFDANFPKEISGSLGTNDFDSQITAGGLVLPPQKTFGATTPFPPQHDGGALKARLSIAQAEPEPAAEPAIEAKKTAGEDGYNGYRYLLDAVNSRQYAVRYERGKVRTPLKVFAGNPQEAGFKQKETIFAFDDETEIIGKNGGYKLSTTGYQITTDDTGRAKNLKQVGVEYDIKLQKAGNIVEAVLTLTAESKKALAETGFSPAFPAAFTTDIEQSAVVHSDGHSSITASALRNLAFPPQHDGSAFIARLNNDVQEKAQPVALSPKVATADARYTMSDAQTLVEKKNLGDGDTLKTVFNFESRRVNEAVLGRNGNAITSTKFEDYDETVLEAVFNRLTKLGGTPRPLETVKKPSLLKPAGGIG